MAVTTSRAARVCDGGIVCDLSALRAVEVDAGARTARAEGGATWLEFDRATHSIGMATTGGMVSTTGIAGLTLGGGLGWLMRAHGLACDQLVSVDLVTADGTFVTCDAANHPDLFWAVRGGGGNFGVATTLTYRLHPVDVVLGGLLMYPLDRAGEVLRHYDQYCQDTPDHVTTAAAFATAPDIAAFPESLAGSADLHDRPLRHRRVRRGPGRDRAAPALRSTDARSRSARRPTRPCSRRSTPARRRTRATTGRLAT